MAVKNILGIVILVLNLAGLGYIFYMACSSLVHHFFPRTAPEQEVVPPKRTVKKEMVVIDNDILPEEDDLLKDMDLSDLDNLNLDDFE